MKIYFHRTAGGNVGDDFNLVLWPRLLPDLEAIEAADWLVGVGTIIDRRLFSLAGRKIVMGSGYRRDTGAPHFGVDVEFRAVRGLLSAEALGLDPSTAVCDPAFVVAGWPEARAGVGSGVGLVPHIYSEEGSGIAAAAEAAGLQVISPRLPVAEFLARLGGCARVYCESLHGAIFADALRVPWARVAISAHYYEGRGVNEFKWRDAFSVLGVDVTPVNRIGLVPIKRSWPAMGTVMRPVQVLAENRLAAQLHHMRDASFFRLSPEDRLRERVEVFLRRVQSLRSPEPAGAAAEPNPSP